MARQQKDLIVFTNDDGIKSPGLAAAVYALCSLGDVLVVAPRNQESSAGRAFYWRNRSGRKYHYRLGDLIWPAFTVDASPAATVRYALRLVGERRPSLLVSGINYGENMGNGLTISGTVGAALEAAASGIPSLAVSLQTVPEFHLSYSKEIDFRSAGYFTRLFARRMLKTELPREARLLNVNVPTGATRKTPWRITRASEQAYFHDVVHNGRVVGYDVKVDVETLEPDSDIYAVFVDHAVSVTPLTYDLTARVELPKIERLLNNAHS